MGYQAAIDFLLQSALLMMPLLVPVVVALLGYWLSKRSQLELTRRRERLELINDRLNHFYGPLYVSSQVAYMAYKALMDKMGGEAVFRQTPMAENVRREWRVWVEHIFLPLNNASEELIVRNAHLVREEEFPESLLLFVTHAALYKAMVVKWGQGDESELAPAVDYPLELRAYAAQAYRELKHEQLALIGKLKPR
jgi:hypothetical protein